MESKKQIKIVRGAFDKSYVLSFVSKEAFLQAHFGFFSKTEQYRNESAILQAVWDDANKDNDLATRGVEIDTAAIEGKEDAEPMVEAPSLNLVRKK